MLPALLVLSLQQLMLEASSRSKIITCQRFHPSVLRRELVYSHHRKLYLPASPSSAQEAVPRPGSYPVPLARSKGPLQNKPQVDDTVSEDVVPELLEDVVSSLVLIGAESRAQQCTRGRRKP